MPLKRLAVCAILPACAGDPAAAVHADAGRMLPACPADPVTLETGATLAGCGGVVPGTGCLGGQPPPSDADLAALSCIQGALDACTPARLDVAQPAADGAPSQTLVVVPHPDGRCDLVVLTADGRSVTRQACTGVKTDTHCLGVWGAGCAAPTTLCAGP